MNDWLELIGIILLAIAGVILLILLGAFVFMLVWNFVMPTFNLPYLDLWQSLALMIIISIIFGGIRITVGK